ncbi:MAG: hypothetical protein N2035_00295 [Chthoniobacterales bacterium]|nr:hypothetical protein [Chthoniobacterales bacterium]
MNAQILEEYSKFCDELEELMQEENSSLRHTSEDGTNWVERKKAMVTRVNELLTKLRSESIRSTLHPGPVTALRDLVMKKLMKLLLLSRETEQLLLKNSFPRKPNAPSAIPLRAIQSVYSSAA